MFGRGILLQMPLDRIGWTTLTGMTQFVGLCMSVFQFTLGSLMGSMPSLSIEQSVNHYWGHTMGYCGLFNFHPLPVSLAASGGISTGHVHVSDCTGTL